MLHLHSLFPVLFLKYLLSCPTQLREAMDQYMQGSLATGIICPSSSPAGAGFFVVDKKDKTLHPTIDK